MRSFWCSLALATAAATATAALIGLTGCTLYFDHGDDGDDVTGDDGPCVANAQVLRLVNPETLACQNFSISTCDGTCGPCPADTIESAPYIPPCGFRRRFPSAAATQFGRAPGGS